MMTSKERTVRNRISWVPFSLSVLLFGVFGAYLYHAQQNYSFERARANLFNKIFDNSETALLVVNTDGLITDWNPAAEHILGWSREEVLGSDMIFLMADTSTQYQHAELWQQHTISERLSGRALRVKCWMNRKDRPAIQVDLEINEIKLRDNTVYTAEIIPSTLLLEIEQSSEEPSDDSRLAPTKHPNFDPQQQIRQMTGGR